MEEWHGRCCVGGIQEDWEIGIIINDRAKARFSRVRTERRHEVLAECELEDCLAAKRQRKPVEAVLSNIHCVHAQLVTDSHDALLADMQLHAAWAGRLQLHAAWAGRLQLHATWAGRLQLHAAWAGRLQLHAAWAGRLRATHGL
jgi:hypothetical protein